MVLALNLNATMKSLVPLYYLRTLGYMNEIRDMETKEAEEFLNEECNIMKEEKYYLIAKWNQTPRKDGIPPLHNTWLSKI